MKARSGGVREGVRRYRGGLCPTRLAILLDPWPRSVRRWPATASPVAGRLAEPGRESVTAAPQPLPVEVVPALDAVP